jgi:DMSO/TMAO reductase YedYZ molybdopterin-dependent catalytic subunit
MATRGFQGRSRLASDAVPPGQFVTEDFPVLTAGPTPEVTNEEWELVVTDGLTSKTYDWASIRDLDTETITVDIHCVTHWSKLGTTWTGVPIAALFEDADVGDGDFVLASSYGDYTTNLPAADLLDNDAMVALAYDGEEIDAEHGGPVRLLVPHLYLWKSAKWLRELRVTDDEPQGFWEAAGYHNYGNPWLEQRYAGD